MKTRVLAVFALSMLAGCAEAPTPKEADEGDIDTAEEAFSSRGPNYLSLGDSIAFGSNILAPGVPPFTDTKGFPEYVAEDFRLNIANAACSGETSGSFLDENALNTGCHSYPPGFPPYPPAHQTGLKVDYAAYGVVNQADYATAFLADHPRTKLVTLNIGANDINLVILQCGGDMTNVACILPKVPAMLAAYQQNLAAILGRIRSTGYTGKLVVNNMYAFNYSDVAQVGVVSALNTVTAAVAPLFGARLSNGFAAFKLASLRNNGDACAAGLLIKLPNGTCDLHPSVKGHNVLATSVEISTLFPF